MDGWSSNKCKNSSSSSNSQQTISIYQMGEVLEQLGLNITSEDIDEIVVQLEMKEANDISFSEAVEVAIYIHERS